MEIVNFLYNNKNEVRTFLTDETWFVAKDVCEVLDIVNVTQAVNRLDEDEKGVCKIYTLGGKQDANIINESGLYNLIFTSNKPEAKEFRRWVTHEVLPSIRKTGSYHLTEIINRLSLQVQNGFKEHKDDYICQFECEKEGLGNITTFLNILTYSGHVKFTTQYEAISPDVEMAVNPNYTSRKHNHKAHCIRVRRDLFDRLRRDFVYRFGFLNGMSNKEYNALVASYNKDKEDTSR